MGLDDVHAALQELSQSLQQAKAAKIQHIADLPSRTMTTFQQARLSAVCANVSVAKSKLVRMATACINNPLVEHETAVVLKKFCNDAKDVEDVLELSELVDTFAEKIADGDDNKDAKPGFALPKAIPQDIHAEMQADAEELQACFRNKCFRSTVILAGRLLETALHRKYFEVTGTDLLEKSPGIGLGNLIARLAEKNLVIDPALGNQIHLINNIRIFSVHTKKEPFYPTEAQAHAIILYTFDILAKTFKN